MRHRLDAVTGQRHGVKKILDCSAGKDGEEHSCQEDIPELVPPLVVISINFISPECFQGKHRNFVGIDSHGIERGFKFFMA
jgi:hypothetical protein